MALGLVLLYSIWAVPVVSGEWILGLLSLV